MGRNLGPEIDMNEQRDELFADVEIHNKSVPMLLDTDSSISIVNTAFYENLEPEIKPILQKGKVGMTTAKLYPCSSASAKASTSPCRPSTSMTIPSESAAKAKPNNNKIP